MFFFTLSSHHTEKKLNCQHLLKFPIWTFHEEAYLCIMRKKRKVGTREEKLKQSAYRKRENRHAVGKVEAECLWKKGE